MCTFVDRPRWAESSWDARGANAAFPLASRPRYFTVTGKSDFSNSEIEYLLSIAHTRTYSPIILPKRWDHHQKPEKILTWKREHCHEKESNTSQMSWDFTSDTLGQGGWMALHGISSFTITITITTDSAQSLKGERSYTSVAAAL